MDQFSPDENLSRAHEAGDMRSSHLPSTFRLSPEDLSQCSTEDLEGLIGSALSGPNTIRALSESLEPVCQDPAAEMVTFRGNLVMALARAVGRLKMQDGEEGHERADQLLKLASAVVTALNHNPERRPPESLNELLMTTSGVFLGKMDHLWEALAQGAHDVIPEMSAWVANYASALALLSDILHIPEFIPEREVHQDFLGALASVLKWDERGMGPATVTSPEVIDLWVKVLGICSHVGDDSLSSEILVIAHSLLSKEFDCQAADEEGGVGEEGVIDLKSEAPDSVYLDKLGEALEESIFALRKCQRGLEVKDFWHQVLKIYSVKTAEWHAALRGLASADAEESGPHLKRLLKGLSSTKASEYWKREMMEWLEMYLEVPGTAEVLLSTFKADSEIALEPGRRTLLLDFFREKVEMCDREMERINRSLVGTTDERERRLLFEMRVLNSLHTIAPRALMTLRELLKQTEAQ